MHTRGERFIQRIAIVASVIGTLFSIIGFGIVTAVRAKARKRKDGISPQMED